MKIIANFSDISVREEGAVKLSLINNRFNLYFIKGK